MHLRVTPAVVLLGVVGVLGSAAPTPAQTISEAQACSVLKKRIGVHDGVAPAKVEKLWFCDVTTDPDHSHPGWLVIGLRSYRECDGICSNLRGWFAVNRKSGEVREWDMGAFQVGARIGVP